MTESDHTFKSRQSGLRPTRREMLRQAANGFAMLPLVNLLSPDAPKPPPPSKLTVGGLARGNGSMVRHHAPRARSVIFLYMDGAPSGQDLFDYKERLVKENGKPFGLPKEPTQFNDMGNTLGPVAKFKQHGESGQWISDLLPHIAKSADRLCVVRSMHADFSEHTNANYFLHTGHGLQGRPSMGAWIGYGLGSDAKDLPAYIVLNGGMVPPGGVDNFHSGFLPAHSQGSLFRMNGDAVANIKPLESEQRQRMKLDLTRRLNEVALAADGHDPALDAAIANHELAYRMQTAVPELLEIAGESDATREMYGCNDEYEHTRTYGRQCLLARRLVERGVRFVELTMPDTGSDRWDQHNNLKRGLDRNCKTVDKPIAALLADLEARGLLEETIVLFGGEFGRTPFAQGSNGRDHNPFGFTMWMAGGGFKPGTSYGNTDEYGYKAEENPVSLHDLHATLMWQLGIDHERFVYRFGGRDLRLTDVYGNVMRDLID